MTVPTATGLDLFARRGLFPKPDSGEDTFERCRATDLAVLALGHGPLLPRPKVLETQFSCCLPSVVYVRCNRTRLVSCAVNSL